MEGVDWFNAVGAVVCLICTMINLHLGRPGLALFCFLFTIINIWVVIGA